MTRKIFFDLVEIRTKLASFFPFLIAVLFTNTYFHLFHWRKTLFFFFGMIAFDMATTAINNYMDFHKAHSEEYKYQENIIGKAQLSKRTVVMIIFGLIGFSAIVGITLAIQTGWLLLVMGCACCFIGVFYTFGPIPLSRMPLGEVFSGVTMGLGIFAITVYLNTYDKKLFFMELDLQHFAITGSTTAALAVVWASIPLIATIANIMLANNLCDLEQDIENHRYTLPFYLGKKNAVILFNLLMYGSYLAIVIGLITGIYQWPILITFLSLLKVYPQTKAFTKEQIKHKTFAMSIKNLVAFNGSYALGLLVTLFWQLI